MLIISPRLCPLALRSAYSTNTDTVFNCLSNYIELKFLNQKIFSSNVLNYKHDLSLLFDPDKIINFPNPSKGSQ